MASFTLTIHPGHITDIWISHAINLLEKSPLEVFQVYATTASFHKLLADRFCMQIIAEHGHRLTRFSFHRLRISLDAIAHICQACTQLREMFVLVHVADLVSSSSLSCAPPVTLTK